MSRASQTGWRARSTPSQQLGARHRTTSIPRITSVETLPASWLDSLMSWLMLDALLDRPKIESGAVDGPGFARSGVSILEKDGWLVGGEHVGLVDALRQAGQGEVSSGRIGEARIIEGVG